VTEPHGVDAVKGVGHVDAAGTTHTAGTADTVDAATGLAGAAAERAGVAIAEVHELDHLRAITRVIEAVWHRRHQPLPVDTLRALAHSGSCVLAAWSGGEMVGASISFRGVHEGRPSLHSHITGIVPDLQLRGVGYALKLWQRAWALSHGIDVVTWTFDPLIARNGHFNLSKLGADADGYLVDFYGPLHDEINGDDATDRLFAVWRLTSPRVSGALSGAVRIPAVAALRAGGAHVALDAGRDGHPLPGGMEAAAAAGPQAGSGAAASPLPAQDSARTDRMGVLVRVPDDIVAVRRADRRCADSWRSEVREAMTALFGRGLRPLAVVPPGWYVFGPAGSGWPG